MYSNCTRVLSTVCRGQQQRRHHAVQPDVRQRGHAAHQGEGGPAQSGMLQYFCGDIYLVELYSITAVCEQHTVFLCHVCQVNVTVDANTLGCTAKEDNRDMH